MHSDFQPYQYQPRKPGSSQPGATFAPPSEAPPSENPSMEDIFGQMGTVSSFSKVFTMGDIFDPMTLTGTKSFFLLFPGDVALERIMFTWSTTSLRAGNPTPAPMVDVTLDQSASYDGSGQVTRPIAPSKQWIEARSGGSVIFEATDSIEPFTPILATIRCVNKTNPITHSWFELDGLELWMTMHFLAGETA